jgi:TatD DNase family protein
MEEKSQFFLTDTHAHLASSRFDGQLDDLLLRAKEHSIERIISISCDIEDCETNLGLSRRYPGVFPTVGIHPTYIHELPAGDWFGQVSALAENPEVAAIGEIGLDYYHPPQDGSEVTVWRRRQREVFEQLLQLARDRNLPVVVHQRESGADVMEVLKGFPGVRAVLHCFTGSPEEAAIAIEMGHYLSFTGVVTYKNADDVRATAATVPADRIMVETDAPFLAPVPFRGKPCEPYMVEHTARALSEIRGVDFEEFARQTSQNAATFFGL